MQDKKINYFEVIFKSLFSVAFMLLSAYVGMCFTGKLGLQIALTLAFSLIFTVLADLGSVDMKYLSFAVSFSAAFWILYAVIGQMLLKHTFFIFSTQWEFMFYYDKIGMVFIVMIVVTVYQRIKAYIKKDGEINGEYRKFYSVTSAAFIFYYSVVLLYCFFISRTPSAEPTPPNLAPFDAFKVTFLSGYFDYERLILFFGNIAIFIPLGYFLCHGLNRGKLKILLVILPIIISSAIEISQYYFCMGHPDVDDVILNVIGFYIGVLMKILFEKAFPLKD